MLRLKAFRTQGNYSQGDLAKMLKTTQQTIARWEAGEVEPPLSALRDFAVIFGVGVDDLLGKGPTKRAMTTHFDIGTGEKLTDGFWGHLGVLLPERKQSKWYPITVGEADRVSSQMQDDHSELRWISVMTLNQRSLYLRPAAIPRIRLLDDGADGPDGDWELEPGSAEGMSAEIHAGLRDYFDYEQTRFKESSNAFKATILDCIKKHNVNENNYRALLHETHVYFINGATHSCEPYEKSLAELTFGLDLGEEPSTLSLRNDDEEVFFATRSIVMIDMPLVAHAEGEKELRKEDGLDEDDATELPPAGKNPAGTPFEIRPVTL